MSQFVLGAYVRKKSGSFWEGTVVGHYSTDQTPDGVAVQLFGWPNGPVQIYPVAALELCPGAGTVGSRSPRLGASFESVAAAYAQGERASLGVEAAFLSGAKFGAMRAANEFMAAQRVHLDLSEEELEALKEAALAQPQAIITLAPKEDLVFTPPPSTHVACPCTLIEQDEDCPVGYPSLLCGACDGKGHTTQEQVTALACEMIKIASDNGGPEDPFAAWESIDLIKSQHERMRKALAPFAEVADRFDGVPVSAILPQQCWFTPHSLREARAALATTEDRNRNTEIGASPTPATHLHLMGDEARRKLSLWFFRDLSGEQRGKLFARLWRAVRTSL